jgi:S1-C subfamily serine protease
MGSKPQAMRVLLLLLLCLITCGGCSGGPYYYEYIPYATREEALAAARGNVARSVAQVEIAAKKIGGKLLVVIPTRDIIVSRGVKVIGGGHTRSGDIEFVADGVEINFLGIADAVRQAELFDDVAVIRSLNPEDEAFNGYDYKLWLFSFGIDQWQWYLTREDFTHRQPVTAYGTYNKTVYLNSFNAMLARAVGLLESRYFAETGKQPRRPGGKKGDVVSTGSGFFISSAGFALTNAHVVDNCGSLRAALRDGDTQPATLVATDRDNDLAVVKISSRVGQYAQLRSGPPVRQGESIVTYGFPLTGLLASHGNLGTGVVSALAGVGNDSGKIQISAPIQPGNSGGPVLDVGGNVVGVVQSKLNALGRAIVTGDIAQNVNFAIKVSVVTSFLEVNNVKYETAPLKKETSAADVGEKAKEFTFLLQCVE